MRVLVGVDEVGRGCLIGDVVSAAVILPEASIRGLNDSKKLSPKRRLTLSKNIAETSQSWSIASCSAAEIDQLNIHQATLLAMKKAIILVIQQYQKLNPISHHRHHFRVLVDGCHLPQLPALKAEISLYSVVKGDQRHDCIAAASILAKVYRDRQMQQLDLQYPEYGFAEHKGYPTKKHLQALAQFGVLANHRRSYAPLKKLRHKSGSDAIAAMG